MTQGDGMQQFYARHRSQKRTRQSGTQPDYGQEEILSDAERFLRAKQAQLAVLISIFVALLVAVVVYAIVTSSRSPTDEGIRNDSSFCKKYPQTTECLE